MLEGCGLSFNMGIPRKQSAGALQFNFTTNCIVYMCGIFLYTDVG